MGDSQRIRDALAAAVGRRLRGLLTLLGLFLVVGQLAKVVFG